MIDRTALMEFAADVNNIDQLHDLFAAHEAAKKKLHQEVWDAATDDPSSIRVETRGRSTGRREHKGIPDGPIDFRLETGEEGRFIFINTFWEGSILVYVNDQLKFKRPGNKVYITSRGCY